MVQFKLRVFNFQWINGPQDDPEDLCLHGDVTAMLGDETITESCTVSASALYLLKSLTEDHAFGQDNQIFPCYGHFMIADKDLANVTIIGCPYGTDLQIKHVSNGVQIITENGTEIIVPFDHYQAEVFQFADQVKAFYDSCSPKILPKDTFERNGYTAFWTEWERRRNCCP